MSEKIQALSPEQEIALKKHHDHWFSVGSSTDRISLDEATSVISKLYAAAKIPPCKRVFLCGSPLSAAILIHLIKNRGSLSGSLWDSLRGSLSGSLMDSLRGSLWDYLSGSFVGSGSIESCWVAYYKFAEFIGVKYEKSAL